MKKEFLPFNESLALKNIGFNEQCFSAYRCTDGEKSLMGLSNWTNTGNGYYEKMGGFCAAPTYQQTFRWFREKHNLIGTIKPYDNHNEPYDIVWLFDIIEINWGNDKECHLLFGRREMETFEEAELECVKRLIKIVTKK